LKYFVNGNQVGPTFNPGQILFHQNLDRVQIGYFEGYGMKNGMASFELYLRSLSQTEIAAAMERSKIYPVNPTCNAK
jgi:hypothetical protein